MVSFSASNGKTLISYMPTCPSDARNTYSDAWGLGGRVVFGTNWIQIHFQPSWVEKGITFLELYPIVVTAHIFFL